MRLRVPHVRKRDAIFLVNSRGLFEICSNTVLNQLSEI